MLKVHIITLYCGESQFEKCCESVRQQAFVDIKHTVIKDKPKKQAHTQLYDLINTNGDDFDFYVKLDADMVFSKEDSLISLLSMFKEGDDALYFSVLDFFTNDHMQSVNIFTNKVKFKGSDNNALFTDKVPRVMPGNERYVVDNNNNVLHAFYPSDYQSFVFGIHRALKVMQPLSRIPLINNSFHQKRTLYKTFSNYKKTGDRKLHLALIGATLVFNGVINTEALVHKNDYKEDFKYALKNTLSLHPQVKSDSMMSLFKLLGYRFLYGFFFYIIRKR